jgi:hypothetical protein
MKGRADCAAFRFSPSIISRDDERPGEFPNAIHGRA